MSTLWSRQWPRELAHHRNNPKAIPLAPGQYDRLCPNCGGHRVMMVFVIDRGPFQEPNGGKVKWLDLPDGKSGWYAGSLEVSSCPVCCDGQMSRWLEANCGLDSSDLMVRLSDFRVSGSLAAKKAGLDTALSLLGMNQSPSGFVTYWGGYGVGKSHLLKGIVNGFRLIGVTARYWRMADLLADIRQRFSDVHGICAVEDAIDDLRRARVLCLDEIDRVNMTGWAMEVMFRLLDARYQESGQMLTCVALNRSPDALPAEFGYLASRMRGGKVVEVGGADMRPAVAVMKEVINE